MYLDSFTPAAAGSGMPAGPECAEAERGARNLKLRLHERGDPERRSLEDFIRGSFRTAYQARLRHFMPVLMSVRSQNGELVAACGLRDPRHQPMFLETYLPVPAEARLAEALGEPVRRAGLMEVGNLAVVRPGFARFLIAALTEHLHAQGWQWAVFTAVPALRNAFARLGICLVELGRAEARKLSPSELALWGGYYDCKPTVMAARVSQSRSALRSAQLPLMLR
ncbi:MAG TPA: thermostable hemolysin [Burkholderiales bacterium]|nr:thermostable hemolysin [Burkholderiales bacterium]